MQKIEENIRIHDKFQFEIKFVYPFDRAVPVTEYTVEHFLFVPNNLGINKQNYSKEQFYSDIQKYIRLKTPVFNLHSMTSGEDNPLEKLSETMKFMANAPDEHSANHNYKYQLKMFCAIFKSAIRDEELFIEKRLEPKEQRAAAAKVVNDIREAIENFRALKPLIQIPHITYKQMALFNFADEYMSILIEQRIFKLLDFLKRQKNPQYSKISPVLLALTATECDYRVKQNYPSIAKESRSNETIVYRSRILKKIMGNILFLSTNIKTEGRLREQISLGFAAGLAMAFATSFIFLSRRLFEDFTVSLFALLIIIYVFKDRVKEITKSVMVKILRKYIYDYKTRLTTSFERKIGFCREIFSFITEDKLPQMINRIRNKDYINELENGYTPEEIIYYKKYIRIYSGQCKRLLKDFNVDGVNDILRFNVRHFMYKMDNPLKNLFVAAGDDDFKKVNGKCLYHVNLILKYGGLKDDPFYRKFRIILNRDGIRRIEKVPCDLTKTTPVNG
ncbi:MAG: hypothetical protein KAS17_02430 [Victivallaceae bacterium]|nr:hypothetical protein [Victivallaceae bacterium]